MSELGSLVYRDYLNQILKSVHKYAVIPVLLLLLLVVFAGTSGNLHSQLLKWGEHFWDSYYLLRADIQQPDCDRNLDVESRLDELENNFSDSDDLGLDDLFDPEPFDREGARVSLKNAKALCAEKHAAAQLANERVTPSVKVFRSIETGVEYLSLAAFDNQRLAIVLLLFLCASVSIIRHHHISFRPVKTQIDHWVASGTQLTGNMIFMLGSVLHYDQGIKLSAVEVQHPLVHQAFIFGVQILCLVSLLRLVSKPKDLEVVLWDKSSVLKSLLTIPLYTYMLIVSGIYFVWSEGHMSGVAIYVGQLFEHASSFLNVGLYIWLGMLLKNTQLGRLVFDVFAPWRLPPEILALVAILLMAVPTAFTGASGIIIIAMGLVVYEELRRVGTRRQLALATTALTGSAGVVLKPCLLVVIIAALNKEVVTAQLYSWGVKIFFLSAIFFLFVTWLTRKDSYSIASIAEAKGPSIQATKLLLPYVGIFAVITFIYYAVLGVYVDEFSAPIILPVIVLGFICYENFKSTNIQADNPNDSQRVVSASHAGFRLTVLRSTKETIIHVGALLMIMALSFAVSGVIERSELLGGMPESFSSPWVAMSVLVLVLVGIGMIMEPFGAVVMVTGTIATLAYNNGIHPVHFWMLTLVAFELGYLTPPVALNHLLTRQVVGEKEASLAAQEGDSFWYRHEKILLPLAVMGLTLIVVAYGPLIYASFINN